MPLQSQSRCASSTRRTTSSSTRSSGASEATSASTSAFISEWSGLCLLCSPISGLLPGCGGSAVVSRPFAVLCGRVAEALGDLLQGPRLVLQGLHLVLVALVLRVPAPLEQE